MNAGEICSESPYLFAASRGIIDSMQESKVFFLDLKENPSGRYLKISERASNNDRSTIVVPGTGVIWFEALLAYFSEFQGSIASKQLQVESKAFYFEIGENSRGRFLRISEVGPGVYCRRSRGRCSLVVPAGGSAVSAWALMQTAMAQMRLVHMPEEAGRIEMSIIESQQVVGPGPSAPSIGETRAGGQVLRAGHKRFFFDLGRNAKGDFLRITEVVGNDRSQLIVPGAALAQFSVAIQECMLQREAAAHPPHF